MARRWSHSFLALGVLLLMAREGTAGGWAFLPDQSLCKLECLNGGVCAFDSQNPGLHKCICFIGLYEGERCERIVENAKPEEESAGTASTDEEDDDTMPDARHEPVPDDEELSDKELMARMDEENDPDSYETELLVGPEEEQTTTTPTPPQEEVFGWVANSPTGSQHKFKHHQLQVDNGGPFAVDSPFNPHIKHYENARASTRTTSSGAHNPAMDEAVNTAWERRPMQPKKGGKFSRTGAYSQPTQPTEEENFEATRAPKKKGRKKPHREESRDAWAADDDAGSWMMSKRRGSGASRLGLVLATEVLSALLAVVPALCFYFNMF